MKTFKAAGRYKGFNNVLPSIVTRLIPVHHQLGHVVLLSFF